MVRACSYHDWRARRRPAPPRPPAAAAELPVLLPRRVINEGRDARGLSRGVKSRPRETYLDSDSNLICQLQILKMTKRVFFSPNWRNLPIRVPASKPAASRLGPNVSASSESTPHARPVVPADYVCGECRRPPNPELIGPWAEGHPCTDRRRGELNSVQRCRQEAAAAATAAHARGPGRQRI